MVALRLASMIYMPVPRPQVNNLIPKPKHTRPTAAASAARAGIHDKSDDVAEL